MLRSPLKRLETEIGDCEARIRLHETRLRQSLRSVREGAVQAVSGRALLAGGAVLGGALGLWWTTRGSRIETGGERRRGGERRAVHARREPLSDRLQHWLPLLLPMLTPMLNRKVALTLQRFGLPVQVRPVDPLPTVAHLDLARYAGLWHEIARLPARHEEACSRDVTAEYTPDAQGRVVVHNRCVREDGQVDAAQGLLRVPDGRRPGEAEVSFAPSALHWWPGAWADHWVLFVDDGYRVALVGTPDRDALWILARQPRLETLEIEALKSLALRHGFDSTRLLMTPQTGAAGA